MTCCDISGNLLTLYSVVQRCATAHKCNNIIFGTLFAQFHKCNLIATHLGNGHLTRRIHNMHVLYQKIEFLAPLFALTIQFMELAQLPLGGTIHQVRLHNCLSVAQYTRYDCTTGSRLHNTPGYVCTTASRLHNVCSIHKVTLVQLPPGGCTIHW